MTLSQLLHDAVTRPGQQVRSLADLESYDSHSARELVRCFWLENKDELGEAMCGHELHLLAGALRGDDTLTGIAFRERVNTYARESLDRLLADKYYETHRIRSDTA